MPRLGSIAEIRMGATLRGRDATRPVPNGPFQLVRIGDISQDGHFLAEKFDRISPKESVSTELFLRSGDVLFPNRGTRTTAIAFRLEQSDVIVGAQFFILRPDSMQVLPEYLAWFLRGEEAAKYFDARRRGTYVQIIQRTDLSELEMPVPPMDAQRKIVELADLAVLERKFASQLVEKKWKFANEQLLAAAKSHANNKIIQSRK
jgi:restriction endonuclease S subunit